VTADHRPVIGRVTEGLTVAMGHYRNGILLAPATGLAVSSIVQGRSVSAYLSEFSPFRI
jgi:glycine oxidase